MLVALAGCEARIEYSSRPVESPAETIPADPGERCTWLREERDRVLHESLARTFGVDAARTHAVQALVLHEIIRDECTAPEGSR